MLVLDELKEAARLKWNGYQLAHQEFGPPGNGKSTRARAKARNLENEGYEVVILDDLERMVDGHTGVQVYSRPRSEPVRTSNWPAQRSPGRSQP